MMEEVRRRTRDGGGGANEERRIREGMAGVTSARNRGEPSSQTAAAEGRGAVIRWERFLPRRFLRVLLVEYDDSTRHIVAALLRKCSYQVSEVADGLKAWEFLKEKHFNFDLVLTEVSMPSLSGISLLSKITNNDVCKNIPVIMMSSHDSIGIVFKCMLKGAADFLVKPVRKNELRNLWQHVWRKHCSNSSGNMSANQIPNQTRCEAVSDNNTDSNHGSANAGNKSRTGNNFEKGNDTQSSCSKPEAENNKMQEREEPAQIENPFSSEAETKLDKDDDGAPQVTTPVSQEDEKAKDKLMGLETQVTLSIQAAASTERIQDENGFDDVIACKEDQVSVKCKEDSNLNIIPSNQNNVSSEPSRKVIDFIGTIANTVFGDNVNQNGLCETTELSNGKGSVSNNSSSPIWELSLRRPLMNSLDEHAFQQRHVLRQSDASAFSRYGKSRSLSSSKFGSSSASLCIRTKECGVDCQPEAGNEGTAAGKTIPFSTKDNCENGGEAAIYGMLSSVSNKEDACPLGSNDLKGDGCIDHSSTEKFTPHPQLGFFPLQIPVGPMPFQSFCTGYGAILHPVYYPDPSSHAHGSSVIQNVKDMLPCDQSGHSGNCLTNSVQYRSCKHSDQSHSSHQSKQVIVNHRVDIDSVDARAAEEADQSASCSRSIYNGSGSNGSNEDTNATLNAGCAVESRNEDGFQSCNGQGSNCDSARREAALIKFRMKRKDRCFEKKVRYHSRKKLAEQRPRLKGQFTRQKVVESTTTGTETDD